MTALEIHLDEQAVAKVVTGYMVAVDTRQWDKVPGFFADQVHVDYTSIRPVPAAQVIQKDGMVTLWRSRFDKEMAYQHALSNLLVTIEGDKATCTGNNVASHVMADASRGGSIVLWQIGVRLNWTLQRGVDSSWLIDSVRAEYLWDRTEPFAGIRLP